MDTSDDVEFKTCFLEEAKDLLVSAEQCFLNLEKNPSDLDNLNKIFRLAHNLKGSSNAVGFADLGDFTHKLESLLVELKESRLRLSQAVVELLLKSNDYLQRVIETLQANLNAEYKDPVLLAELADALLGKLEKTRISNAEPRPAEPLAAMTLETASSSAHATAEAKDETIRVGLFKINDLINNAGELVIYQSVLHQQSLAPGVSIPPLMRGTLAAMKKIIQGTRDLSMGLRMMPIKQTFQKMQRIVRDTSKALGKDVTLHLSGEDTEVDKTVIEQIGDPLVHLVRNAVDHGLEDSPGRQGAGKSATGNVTLSAFHRAGHVVIEVRDDGRGLNAEKLVQSAKRKGILPENAQLTPEQAYQLVFAPGFSTKAEVTDVSGRGVGMDVVKTNITNLQGQVEIETELGKGTCFRISLPLTLAIVDAIIASLGEERYVIPLSQVAEFFRPRQTDINFVYGRSEILTLRQDTLPAYRLDRLLGRGADAERQAWNLTALISKDTTGGPFAVFVDEVIAQQQIVIKPLGAELRGRKGLMGSAILGDGKPALILDIHELTKGEAA